LLPTNTVYHDTPILSTEKCIAAGKKFTRKQI
jgi:hypothetical protein